MISLQKVVFLFLLLCVFITEGYMSHCWSGSRIFDHDDNHFSTIDMNVKKCDGWCYKVYHEPSRSEQFGCYGLYSEQTSAIEKIGGEKCIDGDMEGETKICYCNDHLCNSGSSFLLVLFISASIVFIF